MSTASEPPAPRSRTQLLKSLALFAGLDEETLAQIEAEVEWVSIDADAPLFAMGERGDALYVLASGRLDVWRPAADGTETLIARIEPGQPVGEMALLDEAPRSASVRAARDSVLARLSHAAFERLAEKNPRMLLAVSRVLVERLRTGAADPPARRSYPVIAVVPASERAPLDRFCAALLAELASMGRTALIGAAAVDAALGEGAARATPGDWHHDRVAEWLEAVEADHRNLVLQADAEDTAWTRRCIRQADVVVLLVDATDRPGQHAVAGRLGQAAEGSFDRRELVLIQPDGLALPSRTRRWLDALPVDAHHHVRLGRATDVRRVARFLTGRAVALALSGGASRGFAHIGVIKALREARVPIDLVCGTSMGSIVAAQTALGWDPARVRDENHRGLVARSPFDYRLPLVSAVSGEKLDRVLESFFGDTEVEDTWLRYHSVSCSLGRAQPVVHRSGKLTHAVRCSSALPGLLPPVIVGDDALVDGVFLNNLPADVAQKEGGGRTIAVNVIPALGAASFTALGGKNTLLRQVGRLINPFAKKRQLPILDLVMQGFFLGTLNASARIRASVDLYIEPPADFWFLDLGVLDEAIAVGYEAARPAIDAWLARDPEVATLA